MVTSSTEERDRVMSQVKRVIRPLYSSPPLQYVPCFAVPQSHADELVAVPSSWPRFLVMTS